MALMRCRECAQEVSDKADKCPHCGAAVPQPWGRGKVLVAGLFVFVVGYAVFGAGVPKSESAPTAGAAAPTEADSQKERDFRMVVAGAMWLKQNAHNPESFDLVSALLVRSPKAICYEYRARNAFNALVKEHRVVTETLNSGSTVDWNKYCGGKTGDDFTYARQAL